MHKILFFLISLNLSLIHLYGDQELMVTPYGALSLGKTIGINRDYRLAGALAGFNQPSSFLFADANWIYFNKERSGAEVGFGARVGDDETFYGVNVYYDWLECHSKSFNQISAGIEASVCAWELRANVYLPINRRITVKKIFETYSDGYFFQSKTEVFACQLATLALGRRFDLSNCWLSNFSASILGGPYWVSPHKHKQSYGGLADISFDVSNIFQLRTVISNDSIFKTRVQVIVSLSIPIGRCCDTFSILDGCSSAFQGRPLRQPSIATDAKKCCRFNW